MKMVKLRVIILLHTMALGEPGPSASTAPALSATDRTTVSDEMEGLLAGATTMETQSRKLPGDVSRCSNGMEGIDGNGVLCCPIGCQQCGGAGCTSSGAAAGLGGDSCCRQGVIASGVLCRESGSAPCIIEEGSAASPEDMIQRQPTTQAQAAATQTCSNGIEGIDGNGVVCCPIGCTQCGGADCALLGAATDLGSESCCLEDITASGILCSESGSAPCIIDSGALTGPVSPDCAAKRGAAGSDVVLLMGQSNMSGWGRGYDVNIDGPNNPRIQQWSRANTIITASERLEHADMGTISNTLVGMGTAFGRALVETLPAERNVLLVPTAYRSTSLVDGPWTPGGDLFEDAVTRMTAALASDEDGGNCVAAVLWHQGEADVGARVDHDTYLSAWTDMITTLRARIPAAADAPVVLGEFCPAIVETDYDRYFQILGAVREIPDYVPFTAVASSDGLSSNSEDDLIHFDAASQREYGQRYFDKLADAIDNSATKKVRSYNTSTTFPRWVLFIACVHLWRFR
ncbi:unnamed protein product [Scytosiphon promiscuus]